MSIVKTNPNEVCNSPLNKSSSKQLYSFPRSERFTDLAKLSCDKFYEIPSVKMSRTTGFGFGKKYDFSENHNGSPAPNAYKIDSVFEFDKTHHKGYVMGEGRDKLDAMGPLACVKRSISPGPGNYTIKSSLSNQKWSFRDRTKIKEGSFADVPGPGAYSTTFSIDPKGRYFLSKFHNSCASIISPVSKGVPKTNQNPGPGAYDFAKTCLSPDGQYFVSKFTSSKVKSFSKMHRKTLQIRAQTPGPGNYQPYSEFGFVRYIRTPNNMRDGSEGK